jgi:hypothetical protein
MDQSEKLLCRLERLPDEVKIFIARVIGIREWKVLEHSREKSVLGETDKRDIEDFFRKLRLWDGDRFDELFPKGSEEETADERRAGRKGAKVEDPGEID